MRFLKILLCLMTLSTPVFAASQSGVPPKFPIPWGNSASSPYIRSIPQTSQIGIQNCAASLTDGFPPLTFTPASAGGCPPFGQDMNGILKQLSQWGLWQGAGATVLYDGGFASSIGGYPIGAILSQSGVPGAFWVSTVDNNLSNPDIGGSGWLPLGGTSPLGTVTGSSTTYTQGQCVSTVSRTNAGSPMADTLPGTGPGILKATCKITITNNDTTGLLSIKAGSGAVIKSLANFSTAGQVLLGPGQSATFQSDGSTGYFPLSLPTRTILGADTTFYVAPSGGSNTNTGLTSGTPFDTLQFAFTYLQSVLDLHGYNLTIQATAAGTFPHGFVYGGPFVGQERTEQVLLNGTATFPPTSFAINETTTATATIDTWAGARFKINGFKLNNADSNLLRANQPGTHVILGALEIGTNGGAHSHVVSAAKALIEYQGNLYFDKVNASGAFLFTSGGGYYIAATTPTLTWTFDPTVPTFSSAFVACESVGFWQNKGSLTFVNSFAGPRYGLNGICLLDTGSGGNVNYFPGTVAGSATQNSVYQ